LVLVWFLAWFERLRSQAKVEKHEVEELAELLTIFWS
jgi:hypothetical protein